MRDSSYARPSARPSDSDVNIQTMNDSADRIPDAAPRRDDEKGPPSLMETAEARMGQAATFAWTVPGLAIAGQAFLMTIAFDEDRSVGARSMALFSGLVLITAAGHFLGKHTFNFDLYEAVVERERVRLGLPRMSRDPLVSDMASFPEDTLLRKRQWYPTDSVPLWKRLRNHTVVKWRTVWIWAGALGVLWLIDFAYLVGLIARQIIDYVG